MLFTAIISFSISIAMAQTDIGNIHDFGLQECLDYANKHQTSVLNAVIDTKIADAKVKETIGIGLPQVNGTANFQDFLKVPTTLLPGEFFEQPGTFIPVKFGVKYQSGTALEVSQLIFDGSYIVGLQASRIYKELSTRSLKRTKIETVVAVTQAYYMVLVSNERITLLDANINQLSEQLKQTTALNKNGFAEKIDVDRLSVLYNNLVTERENVRRSLLLGTQMLKFQIGMPLEDSLTVKGKIADINFSADPVVLDSTIYRNRIEYNLSETQLKLNELDLKRYKSQYLPSLAAFGSGSYQFQSDNFSDLYDNRYPSVVVGLQLKVPIFSGFQKANQVKQAKFAVEKSNNDLFNAKNAINLDIQNSATTYTNSLSSLKNQKRNMELANEVLRVSKIKYEQGVGSSIEVTQAQTSLKEAENNYINALYDALTYKVNLEKALGKIN